MLSLWGRHNCTALHSLLHKLEFQTSTPLTNQPSEERILNICKSSWTTSVEIKWNIHINYRTITTKFTSQIFRPGIVGHVPYEQRRIGGTQIPRHDCGVSLSTDTNGLSKPSAALAADPQTHTARGLRYGNRPFSRDFTPASPSYLQRFSPARSSGVRLRMRTAGVRAAASVSFIGLSSFLLFPPPQPALSLVLYFPALFCLAPLFPLLTPQVRCFKVR